jgi:hypothetical protein
MGLNQRQRALAGNRRCGGIEQLPGCAWRRRARKRCRRRRRQVEPEAVGAEGGRVELNGLDAEHETAGWIPAGWKWSWERMLDEIGRKGRLSARASSSLSARFSRSTPCLSSPVSQKIGDKKKI